MDRIASKNVQLKAEDIDNQELLRGVDIGSVLPILSKCPIYELKKDEFLINSGDINHTLFLILSGRFRVHLPFDDSNPLAVVDKGRSMGEISLIDHQPLLADIVAEDDSRVLAVSEAVLWHLLENSHLVALNLLKILAQRLRYGNTLIDKVKELLKDYQRKATIDYLTSLYNRRWLDGMLERVMQRSADNNEPLSVLMMDIDFFKQYNDRTGHIAGDIALSSVSRAIVYNLRPEDMVTRYGGEEFFALMPGLSIEVAMMIAERLREAISKAEIRQVDGDRLPFVTISIGVAEMHPGQTPKELVAAADKALYKAKQAGRNRVSK